MQRRELVQVSFNLSCEVSKEEVPRGHISKDLPEHIHQCSRHEEPIERGKCRLFEVVKVDLERVRHFRSEVSDKLYDDIVRPDVLAALPLVCGDQSYGVVGGAVARVQLCAAPDERAPCCAFVACEEERVLGVLGDGGRTALGHRLKVFLSGDHVAS